MRVDVLDKRKNEIKMLLPKSVPRATAGPRHKEACENTMDSIQQVPTPERVMSRNDAPVSVRLSISGNVGGVGTGQWTKWMGVTE